MKKKSITFVGGGNMSRALIEGLLGDEQFQIRVSNPGREKREQLAALGDIETFADNNEAVANADCVVLAVKPQIIKAVCKGLKAQILKEKPLLISIAAGIETAHLSQWFDGYSRIVRVMPNTPALIGSGACGLYGTDAVGTDDRELATDLFESSGLAIWVDAETKIDAVTALSGSGPAYFFYLIEHMSAAGQALGLDAETAEKLAIETAFGAASMARTRELPPARLRENVTSKGGTTAAALQVFDKEGTPAIIQKAMQAAHDRAVEFGDQLAPH